MNKLLIIFTIFSTFAFGNMIFATHDSMEEHTTGGELLDEDIKYETSKIFVTNGYPIIVNNLLVSKIILNWDSSNLPSGEIFLDKQFNGKIGMQIPKNMPRTMNLDFGSGLESSQSVIKEFETPCFYALEVPIKSEHVEFGTISPTAGRWEPVIKESDQCDEIYEKLLQKESIDSQIIEIINEQQSIKNTISSLQQDITTLGDDDPYNPQNDTFYEVSTITLILAITGIGIGSFALLKRK